MSITTSSVLVEMNLSVWTASKVDKQATDTVTGDAGANRNAAKVHKNLMAGTNLRKDIADYAASSQTWHRSQTLPWVDKGARLLPTSLFLDYKTKANARRNQFDALVSDFLANYPTLVQNARYELGSLFDMSDYPSVDEVRSKFGYRLTFSPVPEAGDFRLDVPADDMRELMQGYEESFKDRIADAMREPWDKLHKLLTNMSDKLIEAEGEDKKRFHETFITNAEAMCQLLTHLNITDDPKLEAARLHLERTMRGNDILDVRESPAVRAEMKGRIDAILDQFDW